MCVTTSLPCTHRAAGLALTHSRRPPGWQHQVLDVRGRHARRERARRARARRDRRRGGVGGRRAREAARGPAAAEGDREPGADADGAAWVQGVSPVLDPPSKAELTILAVCFVEAELVLESSEYFEHTTRRRRRVQTGGRRPPERGVQLLGGEAGEPLLITLYCLVSPCTFTLE